MSLQEDDFLYNAAGEAFAQIVDASDGAKIALSLDGTQVLGAATVDGQPLNPADYELGEPEYEPEPASYSLPDDDEEPLASVADQLAEQKHQAERRLGRELTTAELTSASRLVGQQIERGEAIDLLAAVESAHATHEAQPVNTSDRYALSELAADIYERDVDERSGREIGAPVRQAEVYDTSTTEGQTNAVLDQLAGFDVFNDDAA